MIQDKALAILKSGKNVFLTGSAGTGKTYVLNQYIQYLQERSVSVAITASTGIAATHMNGQTIHSWSGIGVKDSLGFGDLGRMQEKKYLKKNIETAKVLILDEVSMLHKKQLDMLDTIMRSFKEAELPFGGLQLVLSGDFFQLPPVTKNDETNRQKFAFMAKAWVEAGLTVCYLTEQFRQTDNELNDILNDIRTGSVSAENLSLLDEAVYTRFKFEPTRLYSHNMDVDRQNQVELESLSGRSETYIAKTKGREALKEMLQKSVLAPAVLEIKEKAQVMFVRNNYEKYIMNGMIGTVIGFSDETNYPLVKTVSGRTIEAEPEIWSMTDEQGKTLASFTQVPLRLAWAITVHKSQGMTLDSAEIDLTKTFERGQGYVALSRLRNIDGLRLLGYNEISLEVDDLALKADKRFQELSDQADKRWTNTFLESQFNPFLKRSGGLTSPDAIKRNTKKKAAKKSGKSTYQLSQELFEKGLTLAKIADERGLTTGTIVGHLVSLKDKGIELNYARLKPEVPGYDEMMSAYDKVAKRKRKDDFYDDGVTVRSKSLFDALHGEYAYEVINLFKLVMNK
jgi:PIF1-like helicase/Helix-turn-helix domain